MTPPCLTLSNIRYVLTVKLCYPGKQVAPHQYLGVVAIEKGAFGRLRLRSPTLLLFTQEL